MYSGMPSQRARTAARSFADRLGSKAVISVSVCASVKGSRSNTLTGQQAGSQPPPCPVMTTSSRPPPASSSWSENLDGGRIKQVHIFSHQQPRTATHTGQQILLHRLTDQLVELAALGGHRLIAGLARDPQHRRQQRHHPHRIQTHRAATSACSSRNRSAGSVDPVDAAAVFQQGAHRVQADIGVKR